MMLAERAGGLRVIGPKGDPVGFLSMTRAVEIGAG